MDQNQKIFASITAAIMVLMLLFPPFHIVVERGTFNEGFSLITDPPTRHASVNVSQLFVQLLAVGVVGSIICYIVKD